jgi:hypothetical protein
MELLRFIITMFTQLAAVPYIQPDECTSPALLLRDKNGVQFNIAYYYYYYYYYYFVKNF